MAKRTNMTLNESTFKMLKGKKDKLKKQLNLSKLTWDDYFNIMLNKKG